jgi:hypothetical protein
MQERTNTRNKHKTRAYTIVYAHARRLRCEHAVYFHFLLPACRASFTLTRSTRAVPSTALVVVCPCTRRPLSSTRAAVGPLSTRDIPEPSGELHCRCKNKQAITQFRDPAHAPRVWAKGTREGRGSSETSAEVQQIHVC